MFPANYVEVITGGSVEDTSSSRGGYGANVGYAAAQAAASAPSVASVASCGQCGCRDYKPNAFKQGQCVNCYHKH